MSVGTWETHWETMVKERGKPRGRGAESEATDRGLSVADSLRPSSTARGGFLSRLGQHHGPAAAPATKGLPSVSPSSTFPGVTHKFAKQGLSGLPLPGAGGCLELTAPPLRSGQNDPAVPDSLAGKNALPQPRENSWWESPWNRSGQSGARPSD